MDSLFSVNSGYATYETMARKSQRLGTNQNLTDLTPSEQRDIMNCSRDVMQERIRTSSETQAAARTRRDWLQESIRGEVAPVPIMIP